MSASPDLRDRVRALIEGNEHMTVAIVDADGHPWPSPVFYAYDQDYALYWVSAKNAKHSQNVRANPSVGIVIYTTVGHTDAVYIAAEATELNEPDEVLPAMRIMQSRPQPERWTIKGIADVTDDAAWRIYRAIPKELYLRKEGAESGQPIVGRLRVDL